MIINRNCKKTLKLLNSKNQNVIIIYLKFKNYRKEIKTDFIF